MDMPQNPGDALPPPYFAFKTLTNLLVRMEEHGPPPRIDRSFLSNISFSVQPQVMAGLRSLGLIEPDGEVRPLLAQLAQQPDERPRLIGEILRNRFPEAVELGEHKATHQQLEEVFKGYGVTGETLRKAVGFYLQAADYAQLPVSPHFKKPRGSGGGVRTSAAKRTKRRVTAPPVGAASNGASDPKSRYVDLLLKRAEADDNLTDDLLDRIERVIGVAPAAPEQKD